MAFCILVLLCLEGALYYFGGITSWKGQIICLSLGFCVPIISSAIKSLYEESIAEKEYDIESASIVVGPAGNGHMIRNNCYLVVTYFIGNFLHTQKIIVDS